MNDKRYLLTLFTTPKKESIKVYFNPLAFHLKKLLLSFNWGVKNRKSALKNLSKG